MKFGGVFFFLGTQGEKYRKKKGRKRKRQKAEHAIEKKAYRDKFYLVA